jgi:hypothetical protein
MIKTFEQYNEIDPYGEEDWNENDEERISKGDIVICIDDNDPYNGYLQKGQNYKVKDIAFADSSIKLEGGPDWWYQTKRFVKKKDKTFEQYNEMDPYGEEIWDDNNKHIPKIGDIVTCVRDVGSDLQRNTDYKVTNILYYSGSYFLKLEGKEKWSYSIVRFVKKYD